MPFHIGCPCLPSPPALPLRVYLCSFITPPGQGFLPRETALHHQEWAVRLVQQALAEAGVTPDQISCIAFTKVGGRGCSLAPSLHSQPPPHAHAQSRPELAGSQGGTSVVTRRGPSVGG